MPGLSERSILRRRVTYVHFRQERRSQGINERWEPKDDLSQQAGSFHLLVDVAVNAFAARTSPAATYANVMGRTAPGVHAGFKLFFYEDTQHGSPP